MNPLISRCENLKLVCISLLNKVTQKYLMKNWKITIEKLTKNTWFLLNPISNPNLRFVNDFLMSKKPKFWHLITGLRFFSKLRLCHFFYFIDRKLHANFLKKLISSLWYGQRPRTHTRSPINKCSLTCSYNICRVNISIWTISIKMFGKL